MNYYKLESCENLIDRYVNQYGGSVSILEEGVLGLGKVLLHDAPGKKAIVIEERYLNPWSSGHTIRKYNKLPKKYESLIY